VKQLFSFMASAPGKSITWIPLTIRGTLRNHR